MPRTFPAASDIGKLYALQSTDQPTPSRDRLASLTPNNKARVFLYSGPKVAANSLANWAKLMSAVGGGVDAIRRRGCAGVQLSSLSRCNQPASPQRLSDSTRAQIAAVGESSGPATMHQSGFWQIGQGRERETRCQAPRFDLEFVAATVYVSVFCGWSSWPNRRPPAIKNCYSWRNGSAAVVFLAFNSPKRSFSARSSVS